MLLSRRWFPKIASVAVVAIGAGCAGDLSTLEPAGPSASAVARLWWAMLMAALLLFLLVVGLFLAIVFAPGIGRRISPESWIVGGGLALPLPILVALTVYAFWLGEHQLRGGGRLPSEMIRIEALATQWNWRFEYPDLPGAPTTLGTVHIPAGRTVEIAVTSDDVVHSLWVPRLGGKIDAVPGHTTYVRLRADTPGRYGGQCSEYCGTGHAGMRFEVLAHSPEDYPAALNDEQRQ
ncbi:cytochrome c oxidase subunit II [Sinorhizobium alkalisoli]|uniref:Cytochrome aa3 subunit 2 n=1 Tax=Sinorhizobium alkalisoli TaxID=1752398 RepID=A0A1E3VH29_9HYPH|nr:cytochrome c oxidase subunit II [Sinorhizobium alkalisoli]